MSISSVFGIYLLVCGLSVSDIGEKDDLNSIKSLERNLYVGQGGGPSPRYFQYECVSSLDACTLSSDKCDDAGSDAACQLVLEDTYSSGDTYGCQHDPSAPGSQWCTNGTKDTVSCKNTYQCIWVESTDTCIIKTTAVYEDEFGYDSCSMVSF